MDAQGRHHSALRTLFIESGYTYNTLLIDAAGRVVGTSDDSSERYSGSLVALETDGTERWRQSAVLGYQTPALTPDGDIVATTCSSGGVYKYSPDDGAVVWFLEVIQGLKEPSVSPSGNIYFCAGINSDHRLVAVTPDGALDWELALDQRCLSTPAIAADGTLYPDLDADLLAISPSGSIIWRTPFPVKSDYNDGELVIDGDGTIYAIHKGLFAYDPDGELLFEEPNEHLRGAAALGADGTLYVPGDDGRLYAFKE
jgi:outer membrane protein assembly factor BamB